MRTLVYQVATSATVANAATIDLQSPIVRPSIDDRIALQGTSFDAITVDRPEVVFSIVPNAILAGFGATFQTTRFAIQGGWGSASFLNLNPTLSTNVTGALFLNRGVIAHDAEFDGVFQDTLQLTNNTGGTVTLYYLVSVYTRLNNEVSDAGNDLMRRKL